MELQKLSYICRTKPIKKNKMNAIEKEYDLIFRDKNKNELTRKSVWCYSIIDARKYAKIELSNSNINDLFSIIVKRVKTIK